MECAFSGVTINQTVPDGKAESYFPLVDRLLLTSRSRFAKQGTCSRLRLFLSSGAGSFKSSLSHSVCCFPAGLSKVRKEKVLGWQCFSHHLCFPLSHKRHTTRNSESRQQIHGGEGVPFAIQKFIFTPFGESTETRKQPTSPSMKFFRKREDVQTSTHSLPSSRNGSEGDMEKKDGPTESTTPVVASVAPSDQASIHDGLDATQQQEEEIEYPKAMKLALIMIALCLSVFLMALDNTIISTAIPKITDQFHSINDVGWYASSYLLTTCAFQLFFGKLYTFYSIKWVYLTAIGVFEVGSAVCGAAPNSTALIIGRAVVSTFHFGVVERG